MYTFFLSMYMEMYTLFSSIFEPCFTKILGLCSNFVEVIFSLNQTLLTFLLYMRQTWMTQLVLAIFFWGIIFIFPLIWKDSITHMYGLAVYVKEGLPFGWDLSLENSAYSAADSYLCFQLVFDSVSSSIEEVFLIHSSANLFVFGDFIVHQKDWLTFSGGTDRPGELWYNFSISNDLTQIVTQIPDFDSHSPALLDFFLSSDAIIYSTIAFPLLGNSDHVIVSVSIEFPS